MNNEMRQKGLAAENQALDLYLESLYEEETEERGKVIALVTEDSREQGLPAEQSRQGLDETGSEILPASDDGESELDVLQVLLFNLSGLKMAIPMNDLDGIIDWPEKLADADAEIPFCIGMLSSPGQGIPVIDLARLIVPARLRAHRPAIDFERILLIGGRKWGLACHGVGDVVTVESSAVNWRNERPNRKWLAGTISSYGSALLDAIALERLLQHGDLLIEG